MKSSFYVYGILLPPGPQNLSLEGLDGEDVNIKIVDGFAVLYSIAKQESYLASRRNLITHEKVLEFFMEAGYRNVLPMQFGLVVSDWEKFSQKLTNPFGTAMKEIFAKLENNREVGVKVYWEADTEIQKLFAENQELKTQRDSLVGQNLSMDQVVQIGQAIEQETEKMIYNAAYLIPWDKEPEFGEKVEAIDGQFEGKFTIRYNSFTAPFNFAQIEQKD